MDVLRFFLIFHILVQICFGSKVQNRRLIEEKLEKVVKEKVEKKNLFRSKIVKKKHSAHLIETHAGHTFLAYTSEELGCSIHAFYKLINILLN